ncbi:Dihydroorotate dehydrogenase B (NAD(+)), electron transfer subunit [bacterium HR29]|jgi:dihydroorotate dehydrogenase electron transfer subunit|nr:Dihydroorotate dehydrogenase B (NAD(+)), electron transfer subunit [bacterium HR29]
MNVAEAVVLSTEPAYENAFVTWFASEALARRREPGQFVMVHCSSEGCDPFFARPFSYHRVDGDRFALLYTVVGRGTAWLARRQPGDRVRMYGPLGRGIRLPRDRANILLVGGGVGIAPLVDLAETAVSRGHQVVAMMGARTSAALLPPGAWPKEVEYVTVTEDGSAGLRGLVTEHVGAYLDWATKLYACGPAPMFAALADVLRGNSRRMRPEILMEERMPCGWGMCYGCAIFTRRGVKLCCKDGPRFPLFDVF